MNKALQCVVAVLGLWGPIDVAWTADPLSEVTRDMSETAIDPAYEQALAAYVQGRFTRVRQTVDADRAQARRYMSPRFAEKYEAEFNPSVALAEFKSCQGGEEFRIRITQMRHELHDERVPWNDYSTNVSYIEFVTEPVVPADAEPKSMAVQLDWTPREVRTKGGVPLEITREDMLVRRQRVSM